MHHVQPALRLALTALLVTAGAGAAAADTMDTPAPGGTSERIPVTITRPTGDGPFPTGGRGATTGGNAEAWADSIRQVLAFFDQHLAAAPGPR
jgi:hypothetical protein